MNKKPEREYRSMELRMVPVEEGAEPSFFVEGYASTYQAYRMGEKDGYELYEKIEPTAFEGADLSDVVFRLNHTGRVYARSSAGTVEVWPDEHGLANRTDLSRTQRAREVYDDIRAGNYPQMSFAFVVAPDGQHREVDNDRGIITRVITKIAKVFDISPVDFPANPYTELSISMRDFFDGAIEAVQAERLEAEKREKQKQKIRILTEVL